MLLPPAGAPPRRLSRSSAGRGAPSGRSGAAPPSPASPAAEAAACWPRRTGSAPAFPPPAAGSGRTAGSARDGGGLSMKSRSLALQILDQRQQRRVLLPYLGHQAGHSAAVRRCGRREAAAPGHQLIHAALCPAPSVAAKCRRRRCCPPAPRNPASSNRRRGCCGLGRMVLMGITAPGWTEIPIFALFPPFSPLPSLSARFLPLFLHHPATAQPTAICREIMLICVFYGQKAAANGGLFPFLFTSFAASAVGCPRRRRAISRTRPPAGTAPPRRTACPAPPAQGWC